VSYMSIYTALGMWDGLFTLGSNPYLTGYQQSMHHRWAARLMQGGVETQPVRDLFSCNPFPDPKRPPKFMYRLVSCVRCCPPPAHLFYSFFFTCRRVRVFMLEPTQSGPKYWRRRLLHTHTPSMSLEDLEMRDFWTERFPPAPENWLIDFPTWRERWKAEPANRAQWQSIKQLDTVFPDWFWTRFVSAFHPPSEPVPVEEWSAFITAERVRYLSTFRSTSEQVEIERCVGFLMWALMDVFESSAVTKLVTIPNHTFIGLAAMAVVGHGREAVAEALANPRRAADLILKFRLDDGMYYFTVFNHSRVRSPPLSLRTHSWLAALNQKWTVCCLADRSPSPQGPCVRSGHCATRTQTSQVHSCI
jgi:hypothetical protein